MKELILLLPEIYLIATAIGLVFSEVGYVGERLRLIGSIAVLGLAGAFLQTILSGFVDPAPILQGVLHFDALALLSKLFVTATCGLTVFCILRSPTIASERRSELYAVLVSSTLFLCILSQAADLAVVFVGLALFQLCYQFLIALARRDQASTESAIKHVILSYTSSVLFLFGAGLLYLALGVSDFAQIKTAVAAFQQAHPNPGDATVLWVSFAFLFSSVLFQLGAIPFPSILPDLIQGGSPLISAYLGLCSRWIGIVIGIRLMSLFVSSPLAPLTIDPAQAAEAVNSLSGFVTQGAQWLGVFAGLTLVFGGAYAFGARAPSRLISALLICQSGFLLLALSVFDRNALGTVALKLGVEALALIGALWIFSRWTRTGLRDDLDSWKGALWGRSFEAGALILLLTAVVGFPPLPSSVLHLRLIGTAFDQGWPALALLAAFSWGMSGIAVLRFSGLLMRSETRSVEVNNGGLSTGLVARDRAFLSGLVLLILFIGIFAHSLQTWVQRSVQTILW